MKEKITSRERVTGGLTVKYKKLLIYILLVLVFGGLTWIRGMSNPEKAAVYELVLAAGQSYAYGYPLMLMDVTIETTFEAQNEQIRDTDLLHNSLVHDRAFKDENYTAVVRTNLDTLYSRAFLDLSGDPLVLESPYMGETYYLLSIMDAWTNVFAAPGSRLTGPGPAKFLIAGPNWDGKAPEDMELFVSPTKIAWLLGRIQTDGEADYANVHTLQDAMTLTPLPDYLEGNIRREPLIDEFSNPELRPPDIVEDMDPFEFFNRLAHLMKENPPAPEDGPILEQLAIAGINPGEDYDLEGFGFLARMAVKLGVRIARGMLNEGASGGGAPTQEGWAEDLEDTYDIMGSLGQARTRNGWLVALEDMGDYGVNYSFRAGIALIGLGANLVEDAVYYNAGIDREGNLLDSDKKYIIHFEPDNLPPAKAFWSVTIYDEVGFLAANHGNRFAVNDRDPLKYNEDGSLTIYIQREKPTGKPEANWLPSPFSGYFNLTARLYWPEAEVLSGEWFMPGVEIVSD